MSPTPLRRVKADMDFGDAMREVNAGSKVSRREWDCKDYVFLYADRLHIRKADGALHQLQVSGGDMGGTDWFIVTD